VETLFQIIGYSVLGAAALTGTAYWLFKTVVDKWLSSRFAENLEAFKHAQVKELEHLRFKIGGLMDRTTKRQQYEFKVLPELWSRLVYANAHALSVVASFQSYPDVDRMSERQLEEFLAKTGLEEWQKDELRNSTKKSDYYIRAHNFQKAAEAKSEYVRFNQYLHRKGIFISPDLKAKFLAIGDLIHLAIHDYGFMLEQSDYRNRENIVKLSKEGKVLVDEIEAEVQKTIWDGALTFENELPQSL
jgi:hypothetical protein